MIASISASEWNCYIPIRITVKSLLEPAVLLIFEAFQRPILLSKSKKLTNAAGYNKGRVLITI